MTRYNRKRYQSKPIRKIDILFSGQCYLRYRDEDAIKGAQKGDFLFFPRNKQLNDSRLGQYDATGMSGYFSIDVYDGRDWHPVRLNELFPSKEHHFGKSERPLDTYEYCVGLMQDAQPLTLRRTYREHYARVEEDDSTPEEEE